jgi:hypothetical protein
MPPDPTNAVSTPSDFAVARRDEISILLDFGRPPEAYFWADNGHDGDPTRMAYPILGHHLDALLEIQEMIRGLQDFYRLGAADA